MQDISEVVKHIAARLDRLTELVEAGAVPREPRQCYTTAQAGKALGRSAWTVRRWAELGQIRASKVMVGRTGRKEEWRIGHEELLRVEREGASREGTFLNGPDAE